MKDIHLSIYREWRPGSRTYRYLGANLYHPLKWWGLRFGWRVDLLGRLYVYLGRIVLWQDVLPLPRRWRSHA